MLYPWVFFLGLVIGFLAAVLFGIGIVTSSNDLTISSFVFMGLTFGILVVAIGLNCNRNSSHNQGEPPMINPAMKRNKSDTNLELISGIKDMSKMYDDV